MNSFSRDSMTHTSPLSPCVCFNFSSLFPPFFFVAVSLSVDVSRLLPCSYSEKTVHLKLLVWFVLLHSLSSYRLLSSFKSHSSFSTIISSYYYKNI